MTGAQIDRAPPTSDTDDPARSGERRAGIVLAGGHSVRFGGPDKALAELHGETLLSRVVDQVSTVTDGVLVSCRGDQRATFVRALADRSKALCTVADPVDGGGPVVGLAAALRCCRAPVVVVAACDNPLVSPALLDALCSELDGRDAVIPRVDGVLQPTQAAFRRVPLESACLETLSTGERSLHRLLDHLDHGTVRPSDVGAASDRSFVDVNTKETLCALARDGRSAR
jgi:molybdenum cofactor guanylyltransferase